jgi:hypothetical protein
MPKEIVTKRLEHQEGPEAALSAPDRRTSRPAAQAHVLVGAGGSGKLVTHQVATDDRLADRKDKSVGALDGDRDKMASRPAVRSYVHDDVPVHALIAEIEQNPNSYRGCELLGDTESLEKSLPHGTDNLNGGSPLGERRLGLLGFLAHWWRHYTLLVVFLLGLVQDLLKVPANGAGVMARSVHQTLVVISLVVSSGGGTGSALLLLLRDILQYLAQYQLGASRIVFHVHIVLPGVFLDKANDVQAILAKTYAFFTEILARYDRTLPPVRLGPIKLFRDRAPFAWLYLYDTINQHDRLLTSREQIAQVIKHVWEYISFGPVADRYRGLLEYVRTEVPAIFSAAGIAGLEFPVGRIKQQGKYCTGLAVLQAILKPDPDLEKVGLQFFEEFLRQHPDFNQPPGLRRDAAGKTLNLSYQQFAASLKQVPRQHLLAAIENVATQVIEDFRTRLEQAGEQEAEDQGGKVEAAVLEILNLPQGLQIARSFLTCLDRHLAEQQLHLSRQMKRSQEELEALQQTAHAAGGGRLAKLTLKARPNHMQAGYDVLKQQIAIQRQSQQYQVLDSLRNQMGEYRRMVASMAMALTELAKRLQAAEAAYLQRQQSRTSVVFQSLLNEEQINQMVTERAKEVAQSALEGISFKPEADQRLVLCFDRTVDNLDRLHILSPEGIKRYLAYCEQFWAHLDTECSVEGYLRTEEMDLGELIAELERRATPWVAVNRARQMPAEKRLLVLGTETGTEFVSDAPGYLNVVATGDKSRLVLLYTIHGLEVKNLEQAPAWKDAYEQAIARGERLHVVPEVDPLNPDNKNTRRGRRPKNGRKTTGK